MPVSYSSYLQVDALLELQKPLSDGPEHDEHLFIVVHQVYELWFKQILHELTLVQTALHERELPTAQKTLRRILTILKTMVGQIDVIETMSPLSFGSFRGRLESASGFQSAQFRQLELVLGHRSASRLAHLDEATRARLEPILQKPSVYDSFLRYLAGSGYEIPSSILTRNLAEPPVADPGVQKALLVIYKTDPASANLCELMVDLDEGLQEWRYRHVKMVERTIGFKTGTGGSSGAEYLRRTLFAPVFPDLWAVRADL